MKNSMRRNGLFLAVVALFGLALAGPLQAAGGGSSTPKNPDFAAGAKLVAAGDYMAALPLLEKAVATEPGNADAQNYLGYNHRKLGNREKALEHYQLALQADPEHRGANEYLGELYLEMDDLPKAEDRLAVLDRACFFGCDEYSDLKKAIADYKSKKGG